MLVFALFLIQGSLPRYEVTVEPAYLEQLYADPAADAEFPATVTYGGVSGTCTIAFRGGTSLICDKKSWHITVDDPELYPDGKHILLNAQFRDASLMRNTLGLYLTRELGFSAPVTEFVTLSINSENRGVYEHVERIDRLFYQRNGASFGPLFKNVDTMGRLSQQFADTTGLVGFEPKVDSYPYGNQLLELIESCFRGDVSSLAVDEVLAAFAVHVAIRDKDGIIKNFFLHRYDDVWHYYPWDRDATFGNSWMGVYDSTWITQRHLGDIGYFGAAGAILLQPENISEFNSLLVETRDIMAYELPSMVDSIRLLIRDDLTSDPYYQYTASQFDSLCSNLASDIEERAEFLETLSLSDAVPAVEEVLISSSLDMESEVEIEIELNGDTPSGVVCLVSFDAQDEQWFYMEIEDDNEWEIEIPVPAGTYSIHTVFGPYGKNDMLPVFYPSWGMREYQSRPEPTPSARVALADLSPSLFSPGDPVWCGNNLWVLPVENTGSELQDISLCRFSLGEPAGNVFLPGSTLVAPGETFLFTNSMENASSLYGNSSVFGDAGTAYPAGSRLTMFDPSWNTLYSWEIGEGDSLPQSPECIVPSEVNAGGGSDWVELYNCSETEIDVSMWYFTDSGNNVSVIPDGTIIPGFGLLLTAVEPDSFLQLPLPAVPLSFGINPDADSLSLFSRFGDTVFNMGWNEQWPINSTGMMYLETPQSSYSNPDSWCISTPPGSPGKANPGWNLSAGSTSIFLVSQNPCDGSFSFHYKVTATPAEAILFDLAGRAVAAIDLPESFQGDVSADFSGTLPNGVYILYLRSSASSASTRFTVLK